MWYILLAGILFAGIIFSSQLVSCKPTNQSKNNSIDSNRTGITNDTIKALFSRNQIDKKLQHLAQTPAPTKLSFGAECYEMAYHEYSVFEYVCPVCGEKTVYRKNDNSNNMEIIRSLEENLNPCRIEIEKVKGINIKLDEMEFCGHCKPNTENPRLYLMVNIAGQTDTTRISSFNYMDIRILGEFLEDKLIHSDEQDFESPLKNQIPRIKVLLGIK